MSLDRETFTTLARRHFGFLEKEFGMREEAPGTEDLVWTLGWLGETVGVRVGFELPDRFVYVNLWRLTNGRMEWGPDRRYGLNDLLRMRAPDLVRGLLRMGYSERDVEEVLEAQARGLREHATDVLRGDLRVLDELQKVMDARPRFPS